MPAAQSDDNQPITADWLSTWATKSDYCWLVPGSNLIVAKHRNRLRCGLWMILRVEDDGDETELAHVRYRVDIREELELLGVEADGVEMADFS